MFFLGADEITRLNQESLDLAIRVIGSIEYDDLFGDHHVTPFQYSLKAVRFGEIDYLKNTIAITYAIEWQKTGPPRG
jgi:hypothetical protein